ncbi:hypothetical protein SELMODRAFT_445834 [Selaginella moellendorffii]|uniref:Phosphoglycerate mutase-like protein n=1 Tax=Selaginella moellendorffii TaxID=88036 RepID=D8SLP1_SELML|nr:probable 2-carboxy-D-arabinitol-1-phosphatase [Selaginella moellendorffii]EFJ14807.1 hypothetical protein SELMODRAFT_445834 [Selaginella moellendorffii]|eukprot:XP_002984297.1 probable 2-carboxy-D-arabinitol-1-phosphatase [Selaginella moellendorffii]
MADIVAPCSCSSAASSSASAQFARSWWSFSLNLGGSCIASSKRRRNSGNVGFVIRASASSHDASTSTAASSSNSAKESGRLSLNGNSSYATRALEWVTGTALDFRGATDPLIPTPLAAGKRFFLVRHGLSSWNEEGRIQGSSDKSVLTEIGVSQAQRCKHALSKIKFDKCYASPISRAKSSAEIMWSGREEPLIFLESLGEANLLFLEGMKNQDARQEFPELFKAWREDPRNFNVNGVYPVVNLWGRAKKAWAEMLAGSGQTVLVVTHKSILRALICTALGLEPERFRAIDINNSGISSFTVNKLGEPMLDSLNLTAHLHADDVFY